MRDIDRDIPIERHDEVESTSLVARRLVEAGRIVDAPRLIVGTRQTAGRGRFGRAWASPAGGLWCTLIWPIRGQPDRILDGLGLRLGLACLHAIDHELAAHGKGARVELKWPNDVLINGRKVLGLLAEIVRHDGRAYALVGVGVNGDFPVEALPPELRERATTLHEVIGPNVHLNRLIDDLRIRLRDALTTEGIDAESIAEIQERLHGVGEPATVTLPDGGAKTGTLKGLDGAGRLTLEIDGEPWRAPVGAELAHA